MKTMKLVALRLRVTEIYLPGMHLKLHICIHSPGNISIQCERKQIVSDYQATDTNTK